MNDNSSNKQLVCPECRLVYAERNRFFPFCSERCQLVDLGAWGSEKYSIPVTETEKSLSADSDDSE